MVPEYPDVPLVPEIGLVKAKVKSLIVDATLLQAMGAAPAVAKISPANHRGAV